LVLFASVLVVVVAGSFGYFIRYGQKQAILDRFEANRVDTVKALRQVARESFTLQDETVMVNYMDLLKRSQTISYAMVMDPNGTVLVHTDAPMIRKVLSDDATMATLKNRASETPLTQNLKTQDGKAVMDVSVPIVIGIKPAEYRGVARIGFDKEAIQKVVADSLVEMDRRILGAFVVTLVLGLIGAFVLAWVIARPIRALKEGAQKIGEGKLNHRIQVSSNDELRDLADEFNLMAVKLNELDQMKQDFVSNVTHELRSPLTSIRGYLELIINDPQNPPTDVQKDYLSVIKNSAVRLARFIDNLLDVAKIEAHKLKLTPEAVDLSTIVHEMAVLFKPQLDEKQIVFQNVVPKSLPKIVVDKDKFAEILINLTSNAIKFTPQNGLITVAAVEGPNYIEVRLQDSGVGIPPEMTGKLFSKFEQVKSTQGLARNQKGTGLGLAIVKGIIEAHGGKIWIISPVPGTAKGTIFHFTVPKLTDDLKAKMR
jgi:signal transduction histidine kinase